KKKLTPAELAALWDDLASKDAAAAGEAVAALANVPEQAMPWLREHLPPAAVPDADKVRALVAELASDKFAVRTRAEQELLQLGDLAAPALEQALAGKPSLELRRRAELLLATLKEGAINNEAMLRSLPARE